MKVKGILRFYYSAESLERAIDNLILKTACASGGRDGIADAEKVCALIGEKAELSRLWNYLDSAVAPLTERDKKSLEEYAAMRCGLSKLGCEERKEIRRALVKFTRRVRRLNDFCTELRLVGKYYCLLNFVTDGSGGFGL